MENLILFRSMTAVMKGRELLRRNGINSKIIRTPSKLRKGACGYSLQIGRRFDEAERIIREKGISVAGTAAADLP